MRPGDVERFWDDFAVGDRIAPTSFHLTTQRLVVAAGSNRDFNTIHHEVESAQRSGAKGIYANNILLLGMWERAAREFVGCRGVIAGVRNMTMRGFNCAGETVTVEGEVERLWRDAGQACMELRMWSTNGNRLTVGPGCFIIHLPERAGRTAS